MPSAEREKKNQLYFIVFIRVNDNVMHRKILPLDTGIIRIMWIALEYFKKHIFIFFSMSLMTEKTYAICAKWLLLI